MTTGWKHRQKPVRLEKRVEFDDYEQIREFLEQSADYSEKEGYYPDMSFGRTFVSMTLYPESDEEELTEVVTNYADEMDKLVEAARAIC